MQTSKAEIYLGDKLVDRVTVYKRSAVGMSEGVMEAFARQRQLRPHEMFMSPLAVAIALPRLTHDRNERALEKHRITEFLFLSGALQ